MYRLNDINKYRETDRYTVASLSKVFDEVEKYYPVWSLDRELGEDGIYHLSTPFTNVFFPSIQTRIHLLESLLSQLYIVANEVYARVITINDRLKQTYRDVLISQELDLTSFWNNPSKLNQENYLKALIYHTTFLLYALKKLLITPNRNIIQQNGGLRRAFEISIPFVSKTLWEFLDELPVIKNITSEAVSNPNELQEEFENISRTLENSLFNELIYVDYKVVFRDNEGYRRAAFSDPLWELMQQIKYQNKEEEYFLEYEYNPLSKKLKYRKIYEQEVELNFMQLFNEAQTQQKLALLLINILQWAHKNMNDYRNTIIITPLINEIIKRDLFFVATNIFEYLRIVMIAKILHETMLQGFNVNNFLNKIENYKFIKFLLISNTNNIGDTTNIYNILDSVGGVRNVWQDLGGIVSNVLGSTAIYSQSEWGAIPQNTQERISIFDNPFIWMLSKPFLGNNTTIEVGNPNSYVRAQENNDVIKINNYEILKALLKTINIDLSLSSNNPQNQFVIFYPIFTPHSIYSLILKNVEDNQKRMISSVEKEISGWTESNNSGYGYNEIVPNALSFDGTALQGGEVAFAENVVVEVDERGVVMDKNGMLVIDEIGDRTVTVTDLAQLIETSNANYFLGEDMSGNPFLVEKQEVTQKVNYLKFYFGGGNIYNESNHDIGVSGESVTESFDLPEHDGGEEENEDVE